MKNRIRAIRSKLTQPEFGKSLGVSLGSVQAWEYGLNRPSSAMRKLICTTYGVNLCWLETGEGEMYEPRSSRTLDEIAARYNGSPVFRAMLDVYASLSAADQDAVERYISHLAEALASGAAPESLAPPTLEELEANAAATPENAALFGSDDLPSDGSPVA